MSKEKMLHPLFYCLCALTPVFLYFLNHNLTREQVKNKPLLQKQKASPETRPAPLKKVRGKKTAPSAPEQSGPKIMGVAFAPPKKIEEEKPHHTTTLPLPDFQRFKDVTRKKIRFFEFLRPIVKNENRRISKQRDRLVRLSQRHREGKRLSEEQREILDRLAREYELQPAPKSGEFPWTELLKRVDIVPLSLALIQAANESAWGTSRFARQGNNLFGLWCFTESCGIVPNQRADGAKHEVASFESVNGSVRSYLHNLNTGNAYAQFREERHWFRLTGLPLDGYSLASGLINYSERGWEYVKEIRNMLSYNKKLLTDASQEQAG